MPEKEDWTREEIVSEMETMTAVTIPVDIRLEGKTRIFDLHEVEEILRNASQIALGDCGCRKSLQKCDAPLDVCLNLDKEAELVIKQGKYRKVDIEQAVDALKRSHEAGLVHIAYTMKGDTQPFIICSCCACCCHALSGLMRFDVPDTVAASALVASQNSETCLSCGVCVDRCHFQARQFEKGDLVYDAAKCFGCGVCVSSCPTDSISMIKRD